LIIATIVLDILSTNHLRICIAVNDLTVSLWDLYELDLVLLVWIHNRWILKKKFLTLLWHLT